MVNEDLVIAHMEQAKRIARGFAGRSRAKDFAEAEGVALLALVEAGSRFVGPADRFWSFAKQRVWGALIDAVRKRLGRRVHHVFVNLEPQTLVTESEDGFNARVTLQLAMPFLTKAQKRFVNGVLLVGVACESDAEAIGMTTGAYRFNRLMAMRRIREVLS